MPGGADASTARRSTWQRGGPGCGRERRFSSSQPQPPAFVFDIDGVLIRGGTVLPAARRALARLYSADGATGCAWHAIEVADQGILPSPCVHGQMQSRMCGLAAISSPGAQFMHDQ